MTTLNLANLWVKRRFRRAHLSSAPKTTLLQLSGAGTGRPSRPQVELQVKVGRASWLSVVSSARQGAASRQMQPLANETEQSPHYPRAVHQKTTLLQQVKYILKQCGIIKIV